MKRFFVLALILCGVAATALALAPVGRTLDAGCCCGDACASVCGDACNCACGGDCAGCEDCSKCDCAADRCGKAAKSDTCCKS
jgi:hypothetical protein